MSNKVINQEDAVVVVGTISTYEDSETWVVAVVSSEDAQKFVKKANDLVNRLPFNEHAAWQILYDNIADPMLAELSRNMYSAHVLEYKIVRPRFRLPDIAG